MLTLSSTSISNILNGINQSLNSMIIYTGAIPTVDINFTYSVAAYASQALTAVIPITTQVSNSIIRFNPTPTPPNATVTSTATWFVLYVSSSVTKCVIGTIGNQIDGTAPLIIQTTSTTAGQPINIIQLGIKLI